MRTKFNLSFVNTGAENVVICSNYPSFPSEAIHQMILLCNNLVIAQAITKLLYSKVLTSYCTVKC